MQEGLYLVKSPASSNPPRSANQSIRFAYTARPVGVRSATRAGCGPRAAQRVRVSGRGNGRSSAQHCAALARYP